MTTSNPLQTIARWAVAISFFLVPVLVLPGVTNALETNKQVAVVALAALALTSWIGSMAATKRLTLRVGWMNLLPAAFLGSVIVSSVFSLGRYQTWIGNPGQEYAGVLSTLAFVAIFFVLFQSAGALETARLAVRALLLSATVTGLLAVASLVGVFELPFEFASVAGFNTVGTINALGVFLSVAMLTGLSAWLVSGKADGGIASGVVTRGMIAVVTACALFVAVAADIWIVWAVIVAGILLLVLLSYVSRASFPEPRRFAVPVFVLVVSAALLLFRTPVRVDMPVLVSPSYGASWTIARSVISESVPRFILGSGPATFAYDYALYRPDTVNGSIFWNFRFDRAKSHALTSLATLGVLGTVAWAGLMLSVAGYAVVRLLSGKGGDAWKTQCVLFVGWVGILLAHVLSSSNMTLSFLLWAMTGLLAAQVAGRLKEYDLTRSPRAGLISTLAVVAVGVASLVALAAVGMRYAGEVSFARAAALDRSGVDSAGALSALETAAARNASSDIYQRNLAVSYLSLARQAIASFKDAELTPEQRSAVAADVGRAIDAAQRATDLEPGDVSNWVVRGSVYRDVMPFVSNAEDFAAATFERAIALEPGNPSHRTNLGRVHLAVADRAAALKEADDAELAATAASSETQQLAAAEAAFLAALARKSDYALAHYYLAATYERQDRVEEATQRLAALRDATPDDVGLGFQLAMLYTRAEAYDLARAELERVVTLQPEYSNALWFLASLYELNGERIRAIETLRRVVVLNPDNEAVRERLRQMESGQAAAEIPGPVEEAGADALPVAGDAEAVEPAE